MTQVKTRQQEQAQADALFQSIGEGAITTDAAGNITRINPAALSILGMEESDALGMWFLDAVVAVNEQGEQVKPLQRAITRAVMTGKPISEKSFYKDIHDKIIPVFITVSPLIQDGKPVGAIEVFRDISSEYEIDRLKSEFISIASHQLRTPATAVKNFAGLLLEGYAGELTEEQAHLVEQAYLSNELQLEIVNNLLYAARAESDRVPLKLAHVDLVELIKSSVSEQASIIEQRKQNLSVTLPNKRVYVVMDRQFVRMMLENLLSNASKYTADGGDISLSLELNPHFAVLRVQDKGVGVSSEDQGKLFQRFTRIENELSTVRGGSGIGLYLVKRIADLHHYQIEVESEVGKGTAFIITIPRS